VRELESNECVDGLGNDRAKRDGDGKLTEGYSLRKELQRWQDSCAQQFSGVSSIVVLRRLIAIILLFALFGANSALGSVCSSFCSGAIQTFGNRHDHAQMSMDMPGTGDANCIECPPGFGKTVMQRPDCGNSDQAMNLKEDATAVSSEAFTSQLNLPPSAHPLGFSDEFEHMAFAAPRILHSARPLTVPLLV